MHLPACVAICESNPTHQHEFTEITHSPRNHKYHYIYTSRSHGRPNHVLYITDRVQVYRSTFVLYINDTGRLTVELFPIGTG